jgi:hypothetical protein
MDNYLLDYQYRAEQLREEADHQRLLKQLPGHETLFQTMRKAVQDMLRSED